MNTIAFVFSSRPNERNSFFWGVFLALIHNHAFVLFRSLLSLLRDVLLCVAVDKPVTNAASFFWLFSLLSHWCVQK